MGGRHLISRPNVAGKSSLVRVLSDVWPLDDDAGEVSWFVGIKERLLLPQRPYIIPQLSLKENLVYPDPPDTPAMPSEAVQLALLHRVGLSRLIPNGIQVRLFIRSFVLVLSSACDGL